jgi:RimJ/RimL family protein N-acetyltransferase
MEEPGFVLETARLRLRRFTLDDVDDMYRINCDPEVVRYTHDGGTLTREEVERRIREDVLGDYRKHGYGRWAVIHKPDGKVIGFAGLKYLDELKETDLGYRFARTYWGMGIATEAAQAVVDFGFRQLDMGRIIGLTLPENRASIRVLEKVGMKFEKTITIDGIQAAYYAMNAPR